MKNYVVDTCIINWLVEGKINPSQLPIDGEFIASHIQKDEINKTKDNKKRTQLLQKFNTTINFIAPTETFTLGISRLDCAKLGDGEIYKIVKSQLDSLNKGKRLL